MTASGETAGSEEPVLSIGHRLFPRSWLLPCLGLVATLASAFVSSGVPFMPEQNDSAWYYMNVHHALTGEYVWEDRYPSFSGPSLYYPRGGYSLAMYGAVLAEQIVGVDWPTLLKWLQWLAFMASVCLVHALASLLGYRRAAPWAAAACVLYFPFFNFAHVAMSESLSVWLVLLFVWTYAIGLLQHRDWALCLALAIASVATLYRTVILLALPLLWAGAVLVRPQPAGPRRIARALALAILLGWAPVVQAIANHHAFGRFEVQGHSAWHLWNRVIGVDRSIPRHSAELGALVKQLQPHDELPALGWWWQIVEQLSRLGYDQYECDRVLGTIVRDGLREHWPTYLLGCLPQTWHELTTPSLTRVVLPTQDDYRLELLAYGAADRQHVPLVTQLFRQRQMHGPSGPYVGRLRCYNTFATWFEVVQRAGLQFVYVCGWAAWLAVLAWRRPRDSVWSVSLVIGLLPLVVTFGSGMAEYVEHRHRLPVQPLLILAAFAAADDLLTMALAKHRRCIRNNDHQPD